MPALHDRSAELSRSPPRHLRPTPQGVTISGYLQSQLGYFFVHRVMDKEGRSVEHKDLLAAGEIKGQVDVIVPKAPLWKEFVQSGELNPPELRDFPPYNYTYLAVKIGRCTALPAGDENGFSDPFVSLEWGGQRQLTRVKRQTLDPVFEETLYFHVRCYQEFPSVDDVSKFPCVTARGPVARPSPLHHSTPPPPIPPP